MFALTLIVCAFFPAILFLVSKHYQKYSSLNERELTGIGISVVSGILIPVFCYAVSYNLRIYKYEYWGSYVTHAVYEEEWNEYVQKTCSKQVPSGTDSKGNTTYTTEYYDCSYVDYHRPIWYYITSLNKQIYIDESEYISCVHKWHNQKKTGHHSGYTISGDVFTTYWDQQDKTLIPITERHSYKNKVAVSHSVFNFQEIPDKEVKLLGLYEYPKIYENNYMPSVLGYNNSHALDTLNAKYGSPYQIKVFILVYKDKGMDIFEKQRQYWKNGNKNELIFGVGLKDDKVSWVSYMTWCENDEFNVNCRAELSKQIGNPLDIDGFVEYLKNTIPSGWKRKNFKDFDYLTVPISEKYCVIAVLLCVAINVGLVIFNEREKYA